MRQTLLAAGAAIIFSLPISAQPNPSLQGDLKSTMTTRVDGQVQIRNNGDQQILRFDDEFSISREPGAQVRHIDSSGRVTTLGPLKKEQGRQTYAVPARVNIGNQDHIVIYSPRYDEDLATVDLSED